MMSRLAALASGMLFGAGLVVSHMVDPGKVLAFLDIAGRWDPSLALVMIAALAVAIPGFRLAQRKGAPVLGGRFDRPASQTIDRRLAIGAAIFGTGWGLVGFCPGPAIAALAFGGLKPLLFILAMIAGAWIYHFRRPTRAAVPA